MSDYKSEKQLSQTSARKTTRENVQDWVAQSRPERNFDFEIRVENFYNINNKIKFLICGTLAAFSVNIIF